MAESGRKFRRVAHELVGEPLAVGGRTLQPVARIRGWIGTDSGPRGGWGAGWLRVQPAAVIVREADGTEQRMPITTAPGLAPRGMIMTGLTVAGLCLVVMALRGLASRHPDRGSK